MKTLKDEATKIEMQLILLDQKLKMKMESSEMSQGDFAEKTGTNYTEVNHWLRGRRELGWKKILKMAKCFK